jgi:FkbM family methyltransferase
MLFFANDIGAVSQSLQTYGEWAENELGFLKTLIPQGATVVDVGAYIGTHTLAFAHFVGPDGRVISIEPQDESFTLLKKNVAANRLTNIQLEHAAAADHVAALYTSPIHIAEKESFGSAALSRFDVSPLGISAERNQQREELISVKMLTIDSLELSSCVLMKIDVEGFEDLVIAGAEQTIKRLSPVIYAECNSVANGMKTFEIMHKFGYAVRMHLVDAFNQDNFLGVAKNIFGSAREVALVGVSGTQISCINEIQLRPCELLLRIESADDLVLGMLNKPQYISEVLQIGAAACSGGDVWIKETRSFRNERDEARQIAHQALEEAQQARHEADVARAEKEMAVRERDEARQIVHQALEEAQQARHEADVARAHMEAAMLQARFARDEADQAESNLAALLKRYEDLRTSLGQLDQALGAMQASVSWRVTKPLRMVKHHLRTVLPVSRQEDAK